MKYGLRFLPVVQGDAVAAAQWYDDKREGLGDHFLAQFYGAASGILHNPMIYRVVEDDIRRCLLPRFPYSIYFSIEEQTVLIVALFHCARDPGQISEAVRTRPRG
jgi:plasmid stabilization system protein ParE